MLVKFELSTNYCGQDVTEVRRFPDGTSESDIEDYGFELAEQNAESFGLNVGNDEDACFMEYEILDDDISEAEIEEMYGHITDA